jgi:uncharacterized YigZ family protein
MRLHWSRHVVSQKIHLFYTGIGLNWFTTCQDTQPDAPIVTENACRSSNKRMILSKCYLAPASYCVAEIEIKKSRFIAEAFPISSADQAKAFIEQVKVREPSANHHCSGFISGSPADTGKAGAYGFSDDGEPSGTAGKPIYNAIKGANVGGICIVVTRYFGGVKLGTGGLIRAYGDSARAVLDLLELAEVVPTREMKLTFPYSLTAFVDSVVHNKHLSVIDQQFAADVTYRIQVPEEDALAIKLVFEDGGKGQVALTLLDS